MAAIGIIIANKNLWYDIKGYNENNIQRNHMEHDLYVRFIEKIGITNLINLGSILDSPFYHLDHVRVMGNTRKNNQYNLPNINDDNWGLELFKNSITIND